jgi:hypothetical protein
VAKTWKASEALVGQWYSHNKDHLRNPGSGVGAGLYPGDVPTSDFLIEVKYRQRHPIFEQFFERCEWDGNGVLMSVKTAKDGELCIAELFPTVMVLHCPEISRALGKRDAMDLLPVLDQWVKASRKLEFYPRDLPISNEVLKWWREAVTDANRVKAPPVMFLQEAGNRNNVLVIMKFDDADRWLRRHVTGELAWGA